MLWIIDDNLVDDDWEAHAHWSVKLVGTHMIKKKAASDGIQKWHVQAVRSAL